MSKTKELHEYTLTELWEEACGNMLLAIGKGEFRGALFQAMELAMRNGYERGKRDAEKAASEQKDNPVRTRQGS